MTVTRALGRAWAPRGGAARFSPPPSPTASPVVAGVVRPRVLLADGSRRVRAALRRLLEDEGFEVTGEADNGTAAVAGVHRHRPDVALLDVRLPGLDGLSATARILRQVPETRVVICTAVDGVEDQARRLGAYAVVAKGSNPALLVGTLRRALATTADATPVSEVTMRQPA